MIDVDFYMLYEAGRQWRQQADQLTGSVRAFKAASVTGLHPEVQGDMKSFLDTWITITQGSSAAAEDMDTKITAAWSSMQTQDENSRREFSEWLES